MSKIHSNSNAYFHRKLNILICIYKIIRIFIPSFKHLFQAPPPPLTHTHTIEYFDHFSISYYGSLYVKSEGLNVLFVMCNPNANTYADPIIFRFPTTNMHEKQFVFLIIIK